MRNIRTHITLLLMPGVVYDLTRSYTAAQVRAFPADGEKYQLVDGMLLVTPAPTENHQTVVMRLYRHLSNYLAQFGLEDTAYCVAADITWNATTLVQPDLFVRHPEERGLRWENTKRLRLAIEVVSASSRRDDRFRKRIAYMRNGVQTYWIVDPFERQVEVWTPEARTAIVQRETVTWTMDAESQPLIITVSSLWDE